MFEAFGASDPGCVRTNNEDYYLVAPSIGLYLVADGMGGAYLVWTDARGSNTDIYATYIRQDLITPVFVTPPMA